MKSLVPQWKRKFKNFLFIDLKTVAAEPSFAQVPARLQRQWEQKSGNLRNDSDLTVGQLYDLRASYFAEYGRIIAVGIGGLYFDDDDLPHLKIKLVADDDERKVLEQVIAIFGKYPPNELTLCAHNGKEFDFPFLCRRLMVHGMELPPALQLAGKKPWEIPHQDTLERWQFGDKRHFVPLDLLATVLNVPARPLEWSGEHTSYVYHEERDWFRIRRYAQDSMVMLAQVYLRMSGIPLVDDAHIVVSE